MFNEKEVAKMIDERKTMIKHYKKLVETETGLSLQLCKQELEELENQLCCLEDGKF